MRKFILLLTSVCAAITFLNAQNSKGPTFKTFEFEGREYRQWELIIKTDNPAFFSENSPVLKDVNPNRLFPNAKNVEPYVFYGKYYTDPHLENYYFVKCSDSLQLFDLYNYASLHSAVEVVEFNGLMSSFSGINSNQPAHETINLDSLKMAFQNSSASDSNEVIAILDTGVDWLHPSLGGKLKYSSEKGGTPNFDDDGNGIVDDSIGYDLEGDDEILAIGKFDS